MDVWRSQGGLVWMFRLDRRHVSNGRHVSTVSTFRRSARFDGQHVSKYVIESAFILVFTMDGRRRDSFLLNWLMGEALTFFVSDVGFTSSIIEICILWLFC